MKLYEINQEIEKLIDDETGEITDVAKFEDLHLKIQDKLEAIALSTKKNEIFAKALKEEAKTLNERAKTLEIRVNNTKEFLANYMLNNGIKKIQTSKCLISFRKSSSVVLDDEDKFIKKYRDTDLVKEKVTVSIDKTATKKFLKDNISEYAHIEEKQNLQIK